MYKITYLCFVILFCFSLKLSGQASEFKLMQLDFVGPLGYTRHLVLGFTSDDVASDDVDYGYDALAFDIIPDDMFWIIENNRYVIQGVGAYNDSKYYPLGIFLTNSGEIKIVLKSLENFDTPIDVYVYDALLNTFTSINDSNFIKNLNNGDYLNRFYITFTSNSELISVARNSNALSINENEIDQTSINYLKESKELLIKTNTVNKISEVSFYDIQGKQLKHLRNINSDTVKIPLTNINTSNSLIVNLLTEEGKQLNKQIIVSN